MSYKLKKLLRSKFIVDSSSVFSGNVVGQVVLFLSSLIVAKLYSAEDFGIYSLFVAVVSFLILIPPLRLDQALLLEKSKSSLRLILKTICFNSFVLVFLLLPILYIIYLTGYVDLLNKPYIIFFLLIAILTSIGVQVLLQFLNNLALFKNIGVVKASQGTLMGGFQILLGLLNSLKYYGLIIGKIFADFLPSIFQLFQLKKTGVNLPNHKLTVKRYFAVLKKYRSYVVFNTPHALLSNLSSNVPYFILGLFFSNYVLGIFGWVSRSFYAPMTLIANSVGRTFNQRISDRLHDSLPVKPLFYKVTGTLLTLTILPSIMMGYFGEEIYGFVFGETWSEAGTYLVYLLPWYILSFTYSPIAFLPIALGAQKSMLYFEIFSVLTRTSFLIIGGYYQSIQIALSGYSISGAIIILFMFLYILNLINKYEHSITSKG